MNRDGRHSQAKVDLLWKELQDGKPRRRVTGAQVVTAIVIGTVAGLVAVLGSAGPSHGAVVVAPPVRVVVDSPSESFTSTLVTSAAVDRVHAASVWVGYPGDPGLTLAGWATSTSSTVSVRAQLDTLRVTTWGRVAAVAVDDADGRSRPMVLDVRRRSVARLTHAEIDQGVVRLAARVTHFDPGAGKYVSSRLSPVRFQEATSGGWATVATGVTTADGLAGAVLVPGSGAHRYRVVRLDGATVWGATSSPVRVVVPSGPVL